jgi:NAD(P)-dependent dehydrogenase (short-subunit alcohol dehydrogenase family)
MHDILQISLTHQWSCIMNTQRRIALVTGGGTGIGLACAARLHQQGWEVHCAGLDTERAWPEGLVFHKLDVTDGKACAELLAAFPDLDGLVNAAGVILHDQKEFTSEGFDRVIDVNLNAVNRMTLLARQALRARKGSVVNVGSMWSFFGSARNPAYSASKGGIAALTRSHAVAFAPEGVRVNAVAPGWIDTRLASGAIHNPERSQAILSRIPMGRWGTPEDVASVVDFLLSPAAAYVTGVVLPADGGFGVA